MPPGERLIIRSSEIIGDPEAFLYDDHFPPAEPEDRGMRYRHNRFRWDTSGAPQRLWADGTVPYQGRFTLDLRAEADFVDILLSIRNDRADPMGPLEWHFCVVGFECLSVADPELERTFLFDGTKLQSLRDLSGSNQFDMYIVAGVDGFIPGIHLQFGVGPVEAQASVVIVEAISGQHVVALGFDLSYNIFSNHGNRCFHADPHFGTLLPGEELTRRGRLYMMEGDAAAALRRYQEDFAAQ